MEITKEDIPEIQGFLVDMANRSEFDSALVDSFISMNVECEESYIILNSIGKILKGKLVKHDEKIYRVVEYDIGKGGAIQHVYNLGLGVIRVE